MTNEQLAEEIANGKKEYLPLLWEKTRKIVYKAAHSFYNRYKEKCLSSCIDEDDLIQVGYFAMLNAIKDYDKSKEYKFLTYMTLHLKRPFGRLLNRHDTISLYDELGEKLTILDTIEDESSSEDFARVEKDHFTRQLHNALDNAMSDLNPESRDIIKERFYEGKSFEQMAEKRGVTRQYSHRLLNRALINLRKPEQAAKLREYLIYQKDVIDTFAYKGSVSSFRNTQISSTERAVFKLMSDKNVI